MGISNSCCPKENICDLIWSDKQVINNTSKSLDNHVLKNVTILQAIIRGFLYRRYFNNLSIKSNVEKKKTYSNKNKKIKIKSKRNKQKSKKEFLTPADFSDELRPGDLLKKEEIDNLKLNEKVKKTEETIGEFLIDEKEILNLIENNKSKLKKFQIRYQNGDIFIGYMNPNWQREVYGILFLAQGSKYEGSFINNQFSGRGRLIKSSGDYYEGEFIDNKANGFGKLVNLNGGIYIGNWENDKQNGKGEEIFSDGSRYEGSYSKGNKHGLGKMAWADGSIYEGEFVNNLVDGYGNYKWKDGRTYQGEWKNNKMDGVGFFLWTDKKKYFGRYLKDKKHGCGIFIWPGGKKYEGEWQNGKQNGYGIFTFSNKKKLGIFSNGQKQYWLEIDENYDICSRIENEIKILMQNANYSKMINCDESSLTGSY